MIEPILDISHWQGEIKASKLLKAGALGMYIKAGGVNKYNGANYADTRFRENAEKFSKHIPCGCYYFFYPHIDGVKQAKYFCRLLTSVEWNLPPAVDVESNPRHVSQARFQRELKQFVDIVEEEFNRKCVIYTRGWFWNDQVGQPAWAKEHKLWIARYGENLQHPWNNNPDTKLRPRPWTDFWMWQYSADGNMRGEEFGATGSKSIDINKANMTKEEFYAFANWTEGEQPALPPEEEPTPPPDETEPGEEEEAPESKYPHKGFLRRGYYALRLRSRPTTHEKNTVSAIKRGYKFTVYKEVQLEDDLWWLIEIPDGTVGWGARRYQGVNYLEPVV